MVFFFIKWKYRLSVDIYKAIYLIRKSDFYRCQGLEIMRWLSSFPLGFESELSILYTNWYIYSLVARALSQYTEDLVQFPVEIFITYNKYMHIYSYM